MKHKPIIWGLIFMVVGAVGWVFSVVLAVVTLGKLRMLANIFGYIAFFSLPIAIVWELLNKLKKK